MTYRLWEIEKTKKEKNNFQALLTKAFWYKLILITFGSLIVFCSTGSRSNSSFSFYCYCLCCWWLLGPLTGTCQVQSKWNASGFLVWYNLWSIPTGKILRLSKTFFLFTSVKKRKRQLYFSSFENRTHFRLHQAVCLLLLSLSKKPYHSNLFKFLIS